MLTVGSLFSGIGGLDLGLERAGMRTAWFCERDPYCRNILERRFPGRRIYDDVRAIDATAEPVDVLVGGFPCQPVSEIGLKLAQADERWLWPEFARLIRELRPRFVLVENVTGLLARGMGDVLGDLAELGFDADWSVVPACIVGAPHARDRVFIVAYPQGEGCDLWAGPHPTPAAGRGWGGHGHNRLPPAGWPARTSVVGVAHGIPHRVDRIRALGNAVVPDVGEFVGRRVMTALSPTRSSLDGEHR